MDSWILKYSPIKLEDMVLNEDIKSYFQNTIKSNTLNNLCLAGAAGIGKTTLAKLLSNSFNCEHVKFQPCSVDGSIDMVKSTINDFCQIMSEPGKIKIVILDEADQLSQQAQMALRNIIVDSMDDTRFILTCNYLDKIIPALQSRCTPIKLEFSVEDILKHIVKILKLENIKFTKPELLNFINIVVKKKFPDIRAIIEHLQLSCQSTELKTISRLEGVLDDEVILFIQEHIKDPKTIREYLLNNEEKFSSDYIMLANKLFNSYPNNAELMIMIADYIYKMTLVLDKEIQFYAMLLTISKNIT